MYAKKSFLVVFWEAVFLYLMFLGVFWIVGFLVLISPPYKKITSSGFYACGFHLCYMYH